MLYQSSTGAKHSYTSKGGSCMLLPIVETLNEKANIVPAIKLKHRNGQVFLKPLWQLAPSWYGGGNTDITMALWGENPGIDEDTGEFFNTEELHKFQQDELAFFMGVPRFKLYKEI